MTTRISTRDWETLSAYLDGQLTAKERLRLEARLQTRADLRSALEELRRTRAVLRSQPRVRVRRNFTLTPEMVGVRRAQRPTPRLFPVFGLVSALASVLLIIVLVGDFLLRTPVAAPLQLTAQPAMEAVETLEVAVEMESEGAAPSPPTEASRQEQKALEETARMQEFERAESIEAPAVPPAPQGTPAIPPSEAPPVAMMRAPTETMPATPMALAEPELAQPDEVVPESEALSSEGVPEASAPVEQRPRFSPLGFLRVLEVLLASLALISGWAALSLRRSGR